ncbi:hypothetical protein Gbro_0559 [Gordonia bronchialis DSM 43247]|uniref:Uncharacterized protein n=1 Tax=Gordonia bronchialis (strain ATCC 25592 / DSM 43247 / BCRC 13721 / JCM 3198 / KCTC 3076 / NBRC 16047 / NCTC 10667) TaxID=526226 RepID=D0LEH1_GORB4|nr:hypothetical protein [Gordonia bronchialis]ACY19889.1 hypothetical protein Gbro_0559 [Gordonia bronchialis DSM 43247]MCC3322661.1 hypothetical protein [Gordonia bronchialis]QGS26244.1 hypothetical protein FOB84_21040 [Gordonia bronchialis]STQ62666.1 Uncharacterised protein [Gordonia bronchialis]
MSILDRLTAHIEATRPKCALCGRNAVVRITYTTRYSRGDTWGETWCCADHADEEVDYRSPRGMIREIKWL